MRTIGTRAWLAVLVTTGMVLFMGGVVAGSAVGTLIRPEPQISGRPIILGQSNPAGENPTRLFATTDGGAFWSTQRGSGAAVRGDAANGRGGVFVSSHRSASGVQAENNASSSGNGAAMTALGNRNVAVRANSESVAVVASGDELALFAEGGAVITGALTVQGGCDGCTATAIGVNASDAELEPGEVVRIIETSTDDRGTVLLEVEAAGPEDRAFGIVTSAVAHAMTSLDLESEAAHYSAVSGAVAPGGTLRVALGGIVAGVKVDASGGEIQPGDSLGLGASPGVLARAASASGRAIGYALSRADGGSVTVLISRN